MVRTGNDSGGMITRSSGLVDGWEAWLGQYRMSWYRRFNFGAFVSRFPSLESSEFLARAGFVRFIIQVLLTE